MTDAIQNRPRDCGGGLVSGEGMNDRVYGANHVALDVRSILRTCLCALNTEPNVPQILGSNSYAVCMTLEIAEGVMGNLIGQIVAVQQSQIAASPLEV